MKRLVSIAILMAATVFGQVPPFNAAGVTMGHHHLIVSDVAAHKKIWVDVLGGQLSGNPGLEFVKFPGTFLILSTGKPTGGSEGTAADHFAFAVKDYNGTRDKLAAAGVKIVRDRAEAPREFVAMMPDDVKVEFYEDATIATPIAHHHIHLSTTDPDGLRAWYVKYLGAEVKQEGNRTITSIPGSMISFRRVDAKAPGMQGRSFDHTGIGVKNVAEFCTKLAGMGLECQRANPNSPIAFITDPAGTRIEVNQGLENR